MQAVPANMSIRGFDPYDGLSGLRVPKFLRQHALGRQIVVQARKRIPFSGTRYVLSIREFAMVKAVGVFLAASCRNGHMENAQELVVVLRNSDRNLGNGAWGYEFDVQTRWAYYPAGTPNLIATIFVARGLATAGLFLDDDDLVSELHESAAFLLNLRRSAEDGHPFFAYTPTSDRLIHNANLLGAGLVAMSARLRGDHDALAAAVECARTSVRAQRPDGSWPYGEGGSLGWSDNFHTAYNLDGLLQVWLATGDTGIRASLDRGVEHWVRDFFGPAGEPKYYPAKPYPYDIHSAGTAVDLAARLATWGWDTLDLARKVARWTQENLVDPRTGKTYFQKHRFWTDKRNFVRWGEAHWALGRASLRMTEEGRRDPLESAVYDAKLGAESDAC